MPEPCSICGQPAHGSHFGAHTCRACAAFFRRACTAKRERNSCKFNGICTDFSGEKFPSCKSCRVQKCRKIGMQAKNIQFPIRLPKTVAIRSSTTKNDFQPNYIDVSALISQALQILKNGSPSPLNQNLSQLQKMTLSKMKLPENFEKLEFVGEKHAYNVWKFDFLATAKWLTHIDDFSKIHPKVQMQLLLSIWHVYSRIRTLKTTSELWQRIGKESNMVRLCNNYYVDMDETEFDISWLSKHPFGQVKQFLDGFENDRRAKELVKAISSLELSEVELTYMAAQLCFQYAQNRFPKSETKPVKSFKMSLPTIYISIT